MVLENDNLTVHINTFGAELKSITDKNNNEYMWQADPVYWAKTSPILFPIVGSLLANTYTFKGEFYELLRHGFARDYAFLATKISDTKAEFILESNADTLSIYPFSFSLHVVYELSENSLHCRYFVKNKSGETMYFSLGAHPAFSFNGLDLNCYSLQFNNDSQLNAVLLENGLLSNVTKPIPLANQTLPLSYDLFHQDALVFRDLKSNQLVLKNTENNQHITFAFSGFSHFGIWSAPNANFVCLEPWCGVADSINHNQDITQKEGIIALADAEVFEVAWQVTIN